MRLAKEHREIEHRILLAQKKDRLVLVNKGAVRAGDLQFYLNQERPNIVHFSGHGTAEGRIVLEDNSGNARPIPPEALARVFRVLKDNIQCVVLNACFSTKQAQALSQHIDCVVGMSSAIGDEAAIAFSAAFYLALASERSVKNAFDQGINGLMLRGIPRENIPQLLVRNNVNPSEVFLLESEVGREPSETAAYADVLEDILEERDLFVCHATEDKDEIVRPLVKALVDVGFSIWYDEFALKVGDHLRRAIDKGLAQSRYGLVILSPSFFAKEWPQKELDGLVAKERHGKKVVLPIWHNVDAEYVRRKSPTLSQIYAVSTSKGIDYVVKELLKAVRPSRIKESERVVVPTGIAKNNRMIMTTLSHYTGFGAMLICGETITSYVAYNESRASRKIFSVEGQPGLVLKGTVTIPYPLNKSLISDDPTQIWDLITVRVDDNEILVEKEIEWNDPEDHSKGIFYRVTYDGEIRPFQTRHISIKTRSIYDTRDYIVRNFSSYGKNVKVIVEKPLDVEVHLAWLLARTHSKRLGVKILIPRISSTLYSQNVKGLVHPGNGFILMWWPRRQTVG